MKSKLIVPMLLTLIPMVGCQQEQANQGESRIDPPSASGDFTLPEGIDVSKYVLDAEPEGAQDVIAVRKSASRAGCRP